jgi:hypothetical protein
LRQFKAMNPSCPELWRQDALAADNQRATLYPDIRLLQVDARQRHENQYLPIGFNQIGWRFPIRHAPRSPHGRKALLVKSLNLIEQVDCIRPHPMPGSTRIHELTSLSLYHAVGEPHHHYGF